MFTKLFKKSHDPYELGGRWYKIRVNSDSTVVSDLEGVTLSGSMLKMPTGYRIMRFDTLFKSTPTQSTNFPSQHGTDADGHDIIQITSSHVARWTPYLEIYVYCVLL